MEVATLQIKVDSSQVKKTKQELKELGLTARKVAKDKNALNKSLSGLIKKVLALAAAYITVRGAINQFSKAISASITLDRLENKMLAATKSAEVSAASFEFLRDISERLGLEFASAADGFAGFSASALRAGLTFGQTKQVFEDMSEAITSLKIDGDKVRLIFRALEQIASKGTVQMEELKLQLGDSLPGALEIAARAMDKTTAQLIKMIENGEVMADEFLPKFAAKIKEELGGAASIAAQQLQAEINRLKNAVFDLRNQFADSGAAEAWTRVIQRLADIIKDPDFINGVIKLGEKMAEWFDKGIDLSIKLAQKIKELNQLWERMGLVFDLVLLQVKDFFLGILADFEWALNQMKMKIKDITRGGIDIPLTFKYIGGGKENTDAITAVQKELARLDNDLARGGAKFGPDLPPMFGPPKPDALDSYTLGQGKSGKEEVPEEVQKVIDALKFEQEQLGRTAEMQAVYNNLKKAGVTEASAYGMQIKDLTLALEEMKKTNAVEEMIEDYKFEAEQLGRTKAQQDFYNEAKRLSIDLHSEEAKRLEEAIEGYYDMKEAIEKAEEAKKKMEETMKEINETFKDAFKDWVTGASSFEDAIDSLNEKLLELALNHIWDQVFGDGSQGGIIPGSVTSSGGGSDFWGIATNFVQMGLNALSAQSLSSAGGIDANAAGEIISRSSRDASQIIANANAGFYGPGFNTGGQLRVGGQAGVDRNVLSLNGVPISRVSKGESINVGKNSGGDNKIVNVNMTVQTPDVESFKKSQPQLVKNMQQGAMGIMRRNG